MHVFVARFTVPYNGQDVKTLSQKEELLLTFYNNFSQLSTT